MITTPQQRETHIRQRCADVALGKIHRGIIPYPSGDDAMAQYSQLIEAEWEEVAREYDLYHTPLDSLTMRQLMERLRRARADVIRARLNIAWTLGYAGEHYRYENEAYGAYYEGQAEGHQQAQEQAEEELRDVLMERERRRAYAETERVVRASYAERDI